MTVERPNQVWAADITYIPIGRGFLYLVAVMDELGRRMLARPLDYLADEFDDASRAALLGEAIGYLSREHRYSLRFGSGE